MENAKVLVIGAGVIGTDLALTLSSFGIEVILKDINTQAIEECKERLRNGLKMAKMLDKHYNGLEYDDLIARIEFTTQFKTRYDVSVVVENATEDWDVKRRIYDELNQLDTSDTIFCVNTSCLSITRIASLMNDSSRVVGMHFMNPVTIKKLVEVVKGQHTSETTISRARDFLKSIQKSMVVVNDYPGFVSNRLSHLFMNEAAFLVQDQVADPKSIDAIFKRGYGHAMGPLETADLIGLDTVVNSLRVLYEYYEDSKFRCCPLLKRMVDAGLLGKKSGQGFYKY